MAIRIHEFYRQHGLRVRLLLGGALLASALAIALAVGARPTAASARQTCTLQHLFAQVLLGPDKGYVLSGNATLHVNPSGSISGHVVQPKGPSGSVVGQATGRAINLVFTLVDGHQVFSTGTLVNPIGVCKGLMRGPVVGPRLGDIGDWAGTGRGG